MKLIYLTLLMLSVFVSAQSDTLQLKLDSIVREADLMYKYEKIAWNATDLALKNKTIVDNLGGYIIYHQSDTLTALFFDTNAEKAIGRYHFKSSDLNKPFQISENSTDLDDKEKSLILIKIKMINELNQNSKKYDLSFSEGYNPNLVLIPYEDKFHFYIIMGTSNHNIIPFGNDYFFELDKNGDITKWNRIHKSLISTNVVGEEGQVIISFIHSHLPMTPYISATDICTFRLYGVDLFDKKSFIVYSTALKSKFIYDADTNKVIVAD